MAKKDELPGFREKRKILFGEKTSEEKMRETGRRFMEAERYDDALEFFARCEAEDEVREIARVARERGEAALLLRAQVVLDQKPDSEDLVQTAETAEQAGRKAEAYVGYLKAGREQEAERLRAEIFGDSHPAPGEEAEEDRSGE
jgi:hypothetical protein